MLKHKQGAPAGLVSVAVTPPVGATNGALLRSFGVFKTFGVTPTVLWVFETVSNRAGFRQKC